MYKLFPKKIWQRLVILVLSSTIAVGIFLALPIMAPGVVSECNAQSGCCSWHGGVNHCDYDTGRQVCNDNTYSPSCGCSIIRRPSCTINATPQTIVWGQSTFLSWSSVTGSNLSNSSFGATQSTGSKAISPLVSATYSLTVNNIRGSSPCQVAVTVTPKVEIKAETVIEEILVPDEIIDAPEQLKNKDSVVAPGVVGSKDIYYNVTYTNNVESSRTKSGEKVTIEPQKKVIKRGTKEPIEYYLGISNDQFFGIAVIAILLGVVCFVLYENNARLKNILNGKKK